MNDKNTDLLKSSYHYDLPKELIAERPAANRADSRLLYYKKSKNQYSDLDFIDIIDLLPENALLVANRSKVFPCRIFCQKTTGAKAEIFFLEIIKNQDGFYPCLIKSSSKKHTGDEFNAGQLRLCIKSRSEDGTFGISVDGLEGSSLEEFLFEKGNVPIPPYIRGGVSDEDDKKRYQTVFAKETGSVAAPTAGLHFTKEIFEKLTTRGIDQAFVTLHVGLGTFSPVKVDDLSEHHMHSEKYFIDEQNTKVIQEAYATRRPVIAIGTTSLRVLESAYGLLSNGEFAASEMNETDIFIHPGKQVKSINGLITNFHLPESTLLMLVSALIGREKVLELYESAVASKYRFFSYGDAMFLDLK
tara:strand:- start:7456 stop:8529 length:1074 start_codon:yes stop_codon:yes gene_type:complete